MNSYRYLNSFFMAISIYLIASFFLFYVFADTLIMPEKKVEEVKTISLQHVDLKPEPVVESQPEQTLVEPEPIPEPVVETPKPIKKKVEKPVQKPKK